MKEELDALREEVKALREEIAGLRQTLGFARPIPGHMPVYPYPLTPAQPLRPWWQNPQPPYATCGSAMGGPGTPDVTVLS